MLPNLPATPIAALMLTVASTLLAAVESVFVPWAPFLVLYALVLPWPGLAAGTARFGSFWGAFAERPAAVAALSLAILAWEAGVMGFIYERWARRWTGLERISPAAALDVLLAETGRRHGLSPRAVQALFAAYFLLWAPVAEELFFWGYLYPAWRPAFGAFGAAGLVAFAFALRHGLHFLFLPGPYPWPAALAFMASAGGAALGNGLLFETCGSLWPLIALHFAANLLSLAAVPNPVPPACPLVAQHIEQTSGGREGEP